MDNQSKIIASAIVGLALGAVLSLVLFALKQDETDSDLQSAGIPNAGTTFADDWSDVNDSLGG
jgi:hypothetical protein